MTAQTFTGFPKDVLAFLEELAENNTQEWFEANKHRYADGVLAHAPAFVETLGIRLQQEILPVIAYDTRTYGAGSMMRIYRDTRLRIRLIPTWRVRRARFEMSRLHVRSFALTPCLGRCMG